MQQYPTLVREIANPILPAFVSICTDQLSKTLVFGKQEATKGSDDHLTDIFQSFSELIPKYPNLFRPFRAKIWTAATHCLGSVEVTHPGHSAARTTLVHLHQCASKNAVEADWANLSRLAIFAIHDTADRLFRSVHEDWEQSDQDTRGKTTVQTSDGDVCGDYKEELKLPEWRGIKQGTDRLESLIGLLQTMLNVPTLVPVPFSIGQIVNATSRLTSLTVPSANKSLQNQVRINQEISRLEREELFAALPRIHVHSLRLLTDLLRTFEMGSMSVAQSLLEQMLWIFNTDKDIPNVRAECYTVLSDSLCFLAPSWSKSNVAQITKLAEYCCRDVLPEKNLPRDRHHQMRNTESRQDASISVNADAFLTSPLEPAQNHRPKQSRAKYAAARLLPRLLTYIPSSSIPLSLRAELDRTAILLHHKEAMLASILNPVPAIRGKASVPSIMPFFAHGCGDDLLAEGVLRPRMPVIPNLENQENGFTEIDYEDFAQVGQHRDLEPSHPDVTKSRTNINAEGRENLEHLEASTPQNGVSSEPIPGHLSVANPTNPPNHLMDVSSDHNVFKRDWTSANAPIKYGDVTATLDGGEQTPKKLRLSEEGNPRPPQTEDSTEHTLPPNSQTHTHSHLLNMEKSNIAIENALTSPTAELKPEALTNRHINQADKRNADDGESDFEIPTIDPTMDSDDDDEDEAEGDSDSD